MQDADRKTPAILRRLSQAHMSLTATDYRFIIVFNGALITLGNVGILNTNITKAALPIGGKGGSLFFMTRWSGCRHIGFFTRRW